ncbi:MAG TPA: AbrB family transcriptional regulator [Usitatibacter sp.]|nr:AbrB family transcriptional regulator [Usitatibacter sp.]
MENASKVVPVLGGLAVCAVGGAICAWIHTPLPWMLGAIFGMGAAQMAGAHFQTLPGGRNVGMLIVGTSLGLYFTAPVVREVAHYWPWFVFLGFAAIGFGAASALVLMKLGGIDRPTAYFGSMPGGAAEMATMGESYGAKTHLVAVAHTMRMLVIVSVIPISITLAGFSATEDYRPITVPFDPAKLALLFAMAAVAGFVAKKLKAPTAFTMGPLFLSIAITVAGIQLSSVPTWITNVAQVLLGGALGARFERSFIAVAPRLLTALVPSLLVMLVLAALTGWFISVGSGAYIGTSLLSAAPGGIAEMSITAKVLRIGVAFVTAAHVVRYLIVVLFTIPMYRLLEAARVRAAPPK